MRTMQRGSFIRIYDTDIQRDGVKDTDPEGLVNAVTVQIANGTE